MQSDMLSTFGGLFRNEQLLRLSELRLPFRLLADCVYEFDWDSFSPFRFQMALCASQYDCFKLRRSVSPLSTAKFVAAENYYMLETNDGKFLSVTELEKHEATDKSAPIELTVCDTSHTSPIPSCLFSLLPQPDGRVAIQSKLIGKFIIGNLLDTCFHIEHVTKKYCDEEIITLKFGSTNNLSCATKFVLAPESEKQNEWCAEFGGSVGSLLPLKIICRGSYY